MSSETDFFVAGGTLRTSDPSYVTRPADAELLQQLQAGEFCYVLTPRQMGKSSLMVRTAQRLRSAGVRVAIIDLTSIGASSTDLSADQWYLGLLSRLRSDLRLQTDVQIWWQEHGVLGVSQRFTAFLHDVVLSECRDRVVILIDEIDSTLNLTFRDDFFAAIRAIYNERANDPTYNRLTFALFGVATPTDLIQDRERTPFNIGRRIDLHEFTLADAEPLRQGLTTILPGYADAILQRIFHWTNGHPYLTQKLCHAVVLHSVNEWQAETIDQTVDQLVYTAFLSEEGRKDPNLTFVQDRIINSSETEQRQMLRLYRRVWRGERVADDDRSAIQNRLELYGLVRVAQGVLQVRNRIYEQVFAQAWIDSVMPTNRQQRIALIASAIALVLLAGVIAILTLNANPTCDELRILFTQNANDSNTRLGALDGLFRQGDACRATALDLFYSIEPQEQLALFDGLRDLPNERERLRNVIDGVYRTLDTVPDHDLALMDRWLSALLNAGLTEDDSLVASIRNWKVGRQAFQEKPSQSAVIAYSRAISTSEPSNHPALRYDMALAYIKLEEYDEALQQLNTILRIAEIIPAPPTSTVSGTSMISQLSTPTSVLLLPIDDTSTDALVPESQATGDHFTTTVILDVGNSVRSLITYRQRFRNADTMRNTVRELLYQYPALLLYYQENTENYPMLVRLEVDNSRCSFSFHVLDNQNMSPISGARVDVMLAGFLYTGYTDSTGYYPLELPCDNSTNTDTSVQVMAAGYMLYKQFIQPTGAVREISLDREVRLNFTTNEVPIVCGDTIEREFTRNSETHTYFLRIESRISFTSHVKPVGDFLNISIAVYDPTGYQTAITELEQSPSIQIIASTSGVYRIQVANAAISENGNLFNPMGGVGIYTLHIDCSSTNIPISSTPSYPCEATIISPSAATKIDLFEVPSQNSIRSRFFIPVGENVLVLNKVIDDGFYEISYNDNIRGWLPVENLLLSPSCPN